MSSGKKCKIKISLSPYLTKTIFRKNQYNNVKMKIREELEFKT